jgi:hypothetical protein
MSVNIVAVDPQHVEHQPMHPHTASKDEQRIALAHLSGHGRLHSRQLHVFPHFSIHAKSR